MWWMGFAETFTRCEAQAVQTRKSQKLPRTEEEEDAMPILKLRRTLAYASFWSQGSSQHRYTVIFRAVNIAYPDRLVKTYWLFPTESEQLSIYDTYTYKMYTYNMYVSICTTYKTRDTYTYTFNIYLCMCFAMMRLTYVLHSLFV